VLSHHPRHRAASLEQYPERFALRE
jgi:hypothetical protein